MILKNQKKPKVDSSVPVYSMWKAIAGKQDEAMASDLAKQTSYQLREVQEPIFDKVLLDCNYQGYEVFAKKIFSIARNVYKL